jgi:hypothetical protein
VKSFLSIDIDFWNDGIIADKVYDYLDRLCFKLKSKRIPMIAVMNHQQMLRLVNDSKARRLINIDMHSDLAGENVNALSCGTWVSYVRWRRAGGHYLWLHRHSAWEGDCNQDPPIFREGVTVRSISDWGLVAHRRVKAAPGWDWLSERKICDFSLVLSPLYCDRDLEPVFRAIVKEYKIPYLKGVRHEDNRVTIRPPFRKIVRYPHDFASY